MSNRLKWKHTSCYARKITEVIILSICVNGKSMWCVGPDERLKFWADMNFHKLIGYVLFGQIEVCYSANPFFYSKPEGSCFIHIAFLRGILFVYGVGICINTSKVHCLILEISTKGKIAINTDFPVQLSWHGSVIFFSKTTTKAERIEWSHHIKST